MYGSMYLFRNSFFVSCIPSSSVCVTLLIRVLSLDWHIVIWYRRYLPGNVNPFRICRCVHLFVCIVEEEQLLTTCICFLLICKSQEGPSGLARAYVISAAFLFHIHVNCASKRFIDTMQMYVGAISKNQDVGRYNSAFNVLFFLANPIGNLITGLLYSLSPAPPSAPISPPVDLSTPTNSTPMAAPSVAAVVSEQSKIVLYVLLSICLGGAMLFFAVRFVHPGLPSNVTRSHSLFA
jgi:hypothetical protein